jgi:hypothetical protein
MGGGVSSDLKTWFSGLGILQRILLCKSLLNSLKIPFSVFLSSNKGRKISQSNIIPVTK